MAEGECVHSAREVAQIEKARSRGPIHFLWKGRSFRESQFSSLAPVADVAQIIGCCCDVDSTRKLDCHTPPDDALDYVVHGLKESTARWLFDPEQRQSFMPLTYLAGFALTHRLT
jgi:hypothetical protein